MENSQNTPSFARVSGKKVEADFDGGCLTQDGGMLLLRRAEAAVGVVKRMVAALRDRRHPSYIDHTYEDLLRQRVFQKDSSRTTRPSCIRTALPAIASRPINSVCCCTVPPTCLYTPCSTSA